MLDSKPKNTEEYINQFSENVAEVLKLIREKIKETVPAAEETMSYGMPAFKLNGKPLVYFAGYKSHIGFYALPSGNKAFQKKLSNYKTGKGSIQFPLASEMPWKLIEEIIMFRVSQLDEKNKKPHSFHRL
ncbi:iron chaperone [Aequorivita lipolytica]|uniref:DUF1801 domain-containing protein n=1 Tax=Aequorivita lipolytica TaxID=153267 RepID=A0A5C6YPQ5_9FLAO|nr:DUF1801 domain-containing protein [Aequorivita lipolytica]TXD69449.1 DUF1801 domain-containing protein [Aequorivita lipolytica]SRX50922.1 hypothetical protein AEQU2_01401 [Aequorivita lipolytica]